MFLSALRSKLNLCSLGSAASMQLICSTSDWQTLLFLSPLSLFNPQLSLRTMWTATLSNLPQLFLVTLKETVRRKAEQR